MTVDGRVISFNNGQFLKRPKLISFICELSITSVRLVQLIKASAPIEITEEGIIKLLSEWHLQKQESPIEVTEEGIVKFLSE